MRRGPKTVEENMEYGNATIKNKKLKDKIPRLPYDPAAELCVLEGTLFPGGFEKAATIVGADDFATIGGRKIFAAIERLANTGRPISMKAIGPGMTRL